MTLWKTEFHPMPLEVLGEKESSPSHGRDIYEERIFI